MAQWGLGYAWAEWVLTDYRSTSDDPVEKFMAPHSTECDVEHQISRCWILERSVLGSPWFVKVLAAGYRELAIQQLIAGPGGIELATFLGRRPDIICLEYAGDIPTWPELDTCDETLFADVPERILQLTGPFPVTAQQAQREAAGGQWVKAPTWVADSVKNSEPN